MISNSNLIFGLKILVKNLWSCFIACLERNWTAHKKMNQASLQSWSLKRKIAFPKYFFSLEFILRVWKVAKIRVREIQKWLNLIIQFWSRSLSAGDILFNTKVKIVTIYQVHSMMYIILLNAIMCYMEHSFQP